MRKSCWLLCLLLCVALAVPALAQEAEGRTMVVFEASGDVTVSLGGRAAFPAAVGMRLAQGYAVTCGDDGDAMLLIDDTIYIGLAPQSRAHVSVASGTALKLSLEYGELYFNVTEPLAEGESMSLDGAGASMGIRGTVGGLNLQLDRLSLSTMQGHTNTTVGGQGGEGADGLGGDTLTLGGGGLALGGSAPLYSTVLALGQDVPVPGAGDPDALQNELEQLQNTAGQQNQETNQMQDIQYLEDIQAVDGAYNRLNDASLPSVLRSAMQGGDGLDTNLRKYATEQAAVIVNDQTVSVSWVSGTVNEAQTAYDGVRFTLSRNNVSRTSATKSVALLDDPVDEDALAVAAAKAALTNTSVNLPFGATQSDKTAAARSHVDTCIERTPAASGVRASVSHGGGTRYDVALTKGEASDSAAITVIAYVAPDPDIAAVENAAGAISGADFGALDGLEASSQEDAVKLIQNIINGILGL